MAHQTALCRKATHGPQARVWQGRIWWCHPSWMKYTFWEMSAGFASEGTWKKTITAVLSWVRDILWDSTHFYITVNYTAIYSALHQRCVRSTISGHTMTKGGASCTRAPPPPNNYSAHFLDLWKRILLHSTLEIDVYYAPMSIEFVSTSRE